MAKRERGAPDGGGGNKRKGKPDSSVTPVGIRLRNARRAE